jgi:outer membrane immunogenic protein
MKKILILLISLLNLSVASRMLAAQEGDKQKAELAVGYNWLHANTPPGGCGCFSMNGADAEFAYAITRHWSGLADFGWNYNGNVNASNSDLLLANYMAGVRYRIATKSRFKPFAEFELGDSHASGSLSPHSLGVGNNNEFAFATGGGVDLPLSAHFSWRIVRVNYLLTIFDNTNNNHQNNIQVNTGIIYRFGK